jgi:hypothetical protein
MAGLEGAVVVAPSAEAESDQDAVEEMADGSQHVASLAGRLAARIVDDAAPRDLGA